MVRLLLIGAIVLMACSNGGDEPVATPTLVGVTVPPAPTAAAGPTPTPSLAPPTAAMPPLPTPTREPLPLPIVFPTPVPIPAIPLGTPVRWDVVYTEVFSDDFETVQPSLGPAFVVKSAGIMTGSREEVISGSRSLRGSYIATGSGDEYTPYLASLPMTLPLTPTETYQVTFDHQCVSPPNNP